MNIRSSLLPFVTAIAVLTLSFNASAATGLSRQQCASYPFKKTAGEVTHADLMRELGELEVRGYQPGSDNWIYPADLNTAEKNLAVDYKRDCLGAHR
ncbi:MULTISPECIES: hypothetical protein [unclassified Paraburkholderia]|uniref:hypothetical protein n=1 Tax=unclassified Paraburkholderia TaxID=2615204 RepID=UPI002AB17B37|nr:MULTISPECIES: hypothetical protein [unclassified Paraburkholderia]